MRVTFTAEEAVRDLNLSREKAVELVELLTGDRDPMDYAPVARWVRQCHHEPSEREQRMRAADEILGTHGVEAIEFPDHSGEFPIAYCNAGDTYAATLLCREDVQAFSLGSWGDALESLEASEVYVETETEEQTATRLEREQVEWVFRLTGGELESEPWDPFVPHPELSDRDAMFGAEYGHPSSDRTTFRYWYEGVPDYAEADFPERHDVEHRTVVTCLLYENSRLRENGSLRDGGAWTRVAEYRSSGETECPCATDENGRKARVGSERCPYCEADPGDEHGCIYLGDGWAEVVYRREPVWSVTCEHVDTCLGAYVQDHHNRDGEMLLGLSLGTTANEAVDSLVGEVDERVPDDVTEAQLRAAFRGAVKGLDLRRIDPEGDPQDEIPDDHECDGAGPQAWFVLRWQHA